MKWRRITQAEVQEVVNDPDRVEDSVKQRKSAFKLMGDRLFKVTYRIEDDAVLVVTAMVKGGHT